MGKRAATLLWKDKVDGQDCSDCEGKTLLALTCCLGFQFMVGQKQVSIGAWWRPAGSAQLIKTKYLAFARSKYMIMTTMMMMSRRRKI